jgi:hypothetical protein
LRALRLNQFFFCSPQRSRRALRKTKKKKWGWLQASLFELCPDKPPDKTKTNKKISLFTAEIAEVAEKDYKEKMGLATPDKTKALYFLLSASSACHAILSRRRVSAQFTTKTDVPRRSLSNASGPNVFQEDESFSDGCCPSTCPKKPIKLLSGVVTIFSFFNFI